MCIDNHAPVLAYRKGLEADAHSITFRGFMICEKCEKRKAKVRARYLRNKNKPDFSQKKREMNMRYIEKMKQDPEKYSEYVLKAKLRRIRLEERRELES